MLCTLQVTADPRHADRGGRVTFVAPTASLRDTWVKYLRFLVDRLTVNARLANTNRAFDASNNYAGSSNNSAVLNGIFGPLPSLVPNANDINAASNQSGHLPKESLPPPSMFFFPAKVPGLKAAGIDSAPIPVPAPSTSVIQYSETNDSCSSIANTTSTSPEKGGATDVATGTGNSSEVFNSSVNSSNSGVSYPALLAAAGSLPTSTPRPLPNLKNNPLLKFGSPGFVEDQALKWSVVAAMKRGAFFLKVCMHLTPPIAMTSSFGLHSCRLFITYYVLISPLYLCLLNTASEQCAWAPPRAICAPFSRCCDLALAERCGRSVATATNRPESL